MEITPERIKQYLQGDCSSDEAKRVQEWLSVPGNADVARAVLGQVWSNYEPVLKTEKPDVERMLWRTRFRISQNSSDNLPKNKQFRLSVLSRIAAVLFVPMCLVSAYLYFSRDNFNPAVVENSVREIYTKPGTRLHLQLSDGTKVWLNDGTTFRYPEQFADGKREVFVDGEAYFEVKSDKQHPFVVKNPLMKTTVTGTHFNIHGYSADQFFEATLIEGKVFLEGAAGKTELMPGQQLQYATDTKRIEKKQVRSLNSVSWIDGKLTIQNETLGLAIKKISRWYNVEIQLDDPELERYELTCTLANEKMEQCLSLISNALPIQYKIATINNKTKVFLMKD